MRWHVVRDERERRLEGVARQRRFAAEPLQVADDGQREGRVLGWQPGRRRGRGHRPERTVQVAPQLGGVRDPGERLRIGGGRVDRVDRGEGVLVPPQLDQRVEHDRDGTAGGRIQGEGLSAGRQGLGELVAARLGPGQADDGAYVVRSQASGRLEGFVGPREQGRVGRLAVSLEQRQPELQLGRGVARVGGDAFEEELDERLGRWRGREPGRTRARRLERRCDGRRRVA